MRIFEGQRTAAYGSDSELAFFNMVMASVGMAAARSLIVHRGETEGCSSVEWRRSSHALCRPSGISIIVATILSLCRLPTILGRGERASCERDMHRSDSGARLPVPVAELGAEAGG